MKEFKLHNLNVLPVAVKVRSFCNISISFSLDFDLLEGSFIIFRLRGGRNNKNDWYLLQAEDPNKKGFARLTTNTYCKTLPLVITGKELVIKYLICEENGIDKGTYLKLEIFNTLAQSLVEKNKKVEVFVKLPDKEKLISSNPPIFDVINEKFDHIAIFCPSIVSINEKFKIVIRLEDKFKNLVKDFEDAISLYIITENEDKFQIDDVNISMDDEGIKRTINLSLPKLGVFFIEAHYKNTIFSSNPVICQDDTPQERLYWGYIHGHTNKSDGMSELNDYFDNLINAGLDFGTSTEHDHLYETSDNDFKEIKANVKRYHKDKEFVSFFGYEYGTWYSGYGDICIYHNNDQIPIFRSEINKYNSTPKIIKNLKSHTGNVLLITHHSALRPGYRNWDYFDNSIEKLVEIYSTWGNQEYPSIEGNPLPPRYKFYGYGKHSLKRGAIIEKRESFVKDALLRGYKLGFTAGGDDHFGLYPSGQIDPDNGLYPPGIMAVWAPELTKEAIWHALMNRKCYGTTGPRVVVIFNLNKYFMGDIININENRELINHRSINIKIYSPLIIEKVHIIRNSEIIKEINTNENNIEITYLDSESFEKVSLDHSKKDEKFCFYYVRIFLSQNNMAWSSPIWIVKNY